MAAQSIVCPSLQVAPEDGLSTTVSMPRALRKANESDEPAGDRGRRLWQVLAVLGPIVTAVLYWHIARTAIAPRTPWDENHLLQMARLISGDDNVAQLAGSGYYPGWAVIMAPIWWFTHDPATVYAAAVSLSNVIALATIVPLAMLARHLGLPLPQGVALSSIVMILPARSVMADYALSEQAIFFFFSWAVLAAFALWRNPSWWRTVLFVAAVAAAYVTHPRAIALVATAGVWLLAFAVRRWRLALLGLVLLMVSYLAIERFVVIISERVLLGGYGKGDVAAARLENFDLAWFVKIFLNQTWVQVVGTAGLFAIGFVLVAVWAIRELRTRRLGPGAFLLGLITSTMLVSVVWWNRPDILLNMSYARLDAWTYSRYIDHVSAIVVLVALAALVRGVRSSVIAIAAVVFAIGSVPVVFRVAPYAPLWGVTSPSNSTILPWTGLFPDEPFAVPLTPSFTNEARFWLWATVFVFVCFAVYVALRRRPRVLTTVALSLACVLALLANPAQIRPYPAEVTAAVEEIEAVALDGELADIDFDLACRAPHSRQTAINWFPFWLSPRVVELVDRREGEQFGSDLVIACRDWPEADDWGARAFDAEPNYAYRLWVLPGELQDELDAAGRLQ